MKAATFGPRLFVRSNIGYNYNPCGNSRYCKGISFKFIFA